ncbi:MAG: hypothetical protein ACOY0T_23065 [Myxococcota bacterium]
MARIAAGPVVVAVAILVVFGCIRRRDPKPLLSAIEHIVVDTQMKRSHSIGRADVLILGDSSVLMGIDAVQLSHELGGARVESLATIGFMGPRGYAKLLDNYVSAGHTAATLVFLMHPKSLETSESILVEGRYEQTVLDDRQTTSGLLLTEGRREIFSNVIDAAATLPLPGAYGKYYGWADQVARAIRDGHGSLIDPHELRREDCTSGFVPRSASEAVLRRAPYLRASVEHARPARFLVGVTPVPESCHTDPTSRDSLLTQLAEAIGRSHATLNELPAALPDEYFASTTHLNREGRVHFTRLIARVLREP